MRLQLTTLACLLLATGGSDLRADEVDERASSEARLRVYTDDDHVTVVSPSAATQFDLTDSLQLALATSVDVVSAASVDVTTQASPTEIKELRVEGASTLTASLSPSLRLRLGGIVSHETDYDSFRPTLGGQIEVAKRNAIIDLAYTASIDSVTSAADADFKRSRRGHIASVGITQILDSQTYIDLLVDVRRFAGYHASPYRKVPLVNQLSSELSFVDEHTPRLRHSGAGLVQLRRAIGGEGRWFAHGSYRYYGDDWDITSHTLSAQLLHSLARDRYLIGLRLRGYHQGAADFYQAYYQASEMPTFVTRDRILGGMDSAHTSLTVDAALVGGWRLTGMLALTHFRFDNFPAQRERNALTTGLSLQAPM